jgi:hypothetical protein
LIVDPLASNLASADRRIGAAAGGVEDLATTQAQVPGATGSRRRLLGPSASQSG